MLDDAEAVGHHLDLAVRYRPASRHTLVGGDNMDLALAHHAAGAVCGIDGLLDRVTPQHLVEDVIRKVASVAAVEEGPD